MKLIIIILMCFEAAYLQKDDPLNIFETNVCFFQKLNSNIHTILNKLLSGLHLKKSFTKSVKIRMLLRMHYYLNKMAQNNYGAYEVLRNRNGTNADVGENDKNNLEMLLQNIVKEAIENFQNNTSTNITIEPELNYSKSKYSSSSIEHLLTNINEFGLEISDLTMESIIDPIINETETTPPMTTQSSTINNIRRIYKGKKTKIKNYPFLVSLHIMNEFICAGSIISSDMVITAASCLQVAYNNKLYRDSPRTIFIRVGSNYNKRSGDLIPIVQVIFHPEYDSVTLKNNLAIVRMLEKLKLSKRKRIRRIRYDKNGNTFDKYTGDVTILGWGSKGEEKHKIDTFQKLAVAHLNLYNVKDCVEVYSKYYVADTNFCAGFISKGGGACFGDVGGPAVLSGELVGVVSFGPTVCGMPDAPTVFTKVGLYAEWIDNVVAKQPSATSTKAQSQSTPQKLPEVVIIPLFSTPSQLKHKRIDRAKYKDYTEEIVILKKLIQEFLLANKTVIDYIINGDDTNDVLVSAENEKNEIVFDYLEEFKASENLGLRTTALVPLQIIEMENKARPAEVYTKSYRAPAKMESASDSLETLHKTTLSKNMSGTVHEGHNDTKLMLLNDDNSEFYESEYYNDSSESYYELAIPVDETLLTSPSLDTETPDDINGIGRHNKIDNNISYIQLDVKEIWNRTTAHHPFTTTSTTTHTTTQTTAHTTTQTTTHTTTQATTHTATHTTSSTRPTKYVPPMRISGLPKAKVFDDLEFQYKPPSRSTPPTAKFSSSTVRGKFRNVNNKYKVIDITKLVDVSVDNKRAIPRSQLTERDTNDAQSNFMTQWDKGLGYMSDQYDDLSFDEDLIHGKQELDSDYIFL